MQFDVDYYVFVISI